MFSSSVPPDLACSAVSSGLGRRLAALRRARVVPSVSVPPETGGKRAVREAQCAEAGSDSFHFLFVPCESPVTRSDRVSVILPKNSGCTQLARSTARISQNSLARDTGVHDAMQRAIGSGRNSETSSNSWRDTEAWGRGFCAPGGTKSLTTSTRCRVRRFAVEELLFCSRRQEVCMKRRGQVATKASASQELEIVPGCAVTVSYLPSPFIAPVPPGQGSDVRNMLGSSQLEKTIS